MPEQEPKPGSGWTVRKEGPSGKVIALAVVLGLLLVFILQNTGAADVDFLFWDAAVPVWLLLSIAAALGFAAGWIVSHVRRGREGASRSKS